MGDAGLNVDSAFVRRLGAAVNGLVDAANFATFIEDAERHVFIDERFDLAVGIVSLSQFYDGVVGDSALVSTGS